jgi:hypothetical protein
LHQLPHDKRDFSVDDAEVNYVGNILMPNLRHLHDSSPKASYEIGIIAGKFGKDDLDCVRSLKEYMLSFKDNSGRTLANSFVQPIATIDYRIDWERGHRSSPIFMAILNIVAKTEPAGGTLFHRLNALDESRRKPRRRDRRTR